jgi:hypothetical protein
MVALIHDGRLGQPMPLLGLLHLSSDPRLAGNTRRLVKAIDRPSLLHGADG